jgi:hypothetical protein
MKVKSYGMGISVTHLTAAVGWFLVVLGLLALLLIGFSLGDMIFDFYRFFAACTCVVSGFSIILFSLLTRSNLENAEMTSEILQIVSNHAKQEILANGKPPVQQRIINEMDNIGVEGGINEPDNDEIKDIDKLSIKELVDVTGREMYKGFAIVRTSDGYRAYGKEFEDFKDVLEFLDQVAS